MVSLVNYIPHLSKKIPVFYNILQKYRQKQNFPNNSMRADLIIPNQIDIIEKAKHYEHIIRRKKIYRLISLMNIIIKILKKY